ncbi:MAG: hypothetical protein WCI18_01890 [Pseudomonadota bacterium]
MRRSGTVKFLSSVNLFKFVHKVLVDQKGAKINDQDVGNILEYNPSDCSHWKRGEKSVKSVFALNQIAEVLNVEPTLIFDIASGNIGVDEGWFEYQETRSIQSVLRNLNGIPRERIQIVKERAISFAAQLLKQADFRAAPLYVPEVVRFFAFVSLQPADLIDRMSRILRVKAGQYVIQFPKGDLKPQTRHAMVKELVRIICEGERERFPELGERDQELLEFEELVIATNLLMPYAMLKAEMSKIDVKKNIVNELAATFWIPKTLVSLQLSQMLTSGDRIDLIPRTTSEAILSR